MPKNIKIGIKTCRGNSGNTALYGGGVYVLDNGKVQNGKLYRNTGTFGGDDLSVEGIVSISTDDYSALFSEEVTAGGYDTLGWFPDAEGSRYNAENPPELVSSTDKLSGVAVSLSYIKSLPLSRNQNPRLRPLLSHLSRLPVDIDTTPPSLSWK